MKLEVEYELCSVLLNDNFSTFLLHARPVHVFPPPFYNDVKKHTLWQSILSLMLCTSLSQQIFARSFSEVGGDMAIRGTCVISSWSPQWDGCFSFLSLWLKSLQQMVLSHEPSVNSVREKGEALLELVQDQTLKDKIQKLQSDFQDLCSMGKVRRGWYWACWLPRRWQSLLLSPLL